MNGQPSPTSSVEAIEHFKLEKDYDKVIDWLDIPNKFPPTSEDEYDEIMESWEHTCRFRHVSNEVLKEVAYRFARNVAQRKIERKGFLQLMYPDFKNALARDLYPHSLSQMNLLERLMTGKIEGNHLMEHVEEHEEMYHRYLMLSERWGTRPKFTEVELIDSFLRKLPRHILSALAKNPIPETWDDLVEKLRCHERTAQRLRYLLGGEDTALSINSDDDQTSEYTHSTWSPPQQIVHGHKSWVIDLDGSKVCVECYGKGHFSNRCPNRGSMRKCRICHGSHEEEKCRAMVFRDEDGNPALIFHHTRKGIHMKIKDLSTAKSLCDAINRRLTLEAEKRRRWTGKPRQKKVAAEY